MALQDEYSEALNNCIERLASGESIEAIMRDYPTMAQDLRPMLEVGNLFKRVHFPATEVSAAQSRIAPKIQEAAQASFGASPTAYWPLLGIILVLGIIAIVWQTQSNPVAPAEISPTASLEAETTPEVETTAQVEITPEATEAAPLLTIEGAVESINANIITIYGMEIALEPNDPLLTVIQLGDVLRIEGEYQEGETIIFIAISIVFVDADVFVNEGEVWRDVGNCNNPPPPWAPANGWRRRCEGGTGNGNGNGNGNGSGRGGSGRS